MNVLEKFTKIRAVVLDMDGVLTDGGLLIMPDGEWIRRMDIKDGYALQLAVRSGIHVVVMTGSSSAPVEARLKRLGIKEIYHQVENKAECLKQLLNTWQLSSDEILYMGDDVPDLAALQLAGLSCCPADAVRDVLEIADYISPYKGGMGCVRDVLEKLLRTQGKWSVQNQLTSI
jgi:3-deoxy-D-manno-octulosonate 8-phosphate phosphatase (KDO 8-P phosphatase)